ncbi:MAG TPA: hypothetical protein VNW54_13925 [Granulicella sp.]|jgi:hypothetical protein|nr:hypothetical protein [Granulicella sp.]
MSLTTDHMLLLSVQSLSVHSLPLWFLVFALFLPRVALVVAWFDRDLVRFHLDSLIAPILALLLPRVLILVLIYRDQGLSLWFLIHAIAAVVVWSGTGGRGYYTRRRGRVVEEYYRG